MATQPFASLVPKIASSVPGCPHAIILQHIRNVAIEVCERALAWRYEMPEITLYPGVHEYFYNKPDNAEVHAVLSASVNCAPLRVLYLEQAVRAYREILCSKKSALLWDQTGEAPEDLFIAWDYGELDVEPKVQPISFIWGQAPFPFSSIDILWTDTLISPEPEIQIIPFVWNHTPRSFMGLDIFWNDKFVSRIYFSKPRFIRRFAKGGTPYAITQVSPDRFIVAPFPDDKRPYHLKMFLALKPTSTADGMDDAILAELEESIVHGVLQRLLVLPKQKWTDRELAAYHAKQYLAKATERRARANLTNARATLRVQYPQF